MGEIKRGIVFGCFDPIHYGHIRMLKSCRTLCTHLTVMIHSDEYIRKEKGREPFFNELLRMEDVIGVQWADFVYINRGTDRNEWIVEANASVIFVSGDMNGQGFICETIKIPRTPGINSTQLRSK